MKKLLIVLLALTVIGLMAYADDEAPTVGFSGRVETGIQTNPGNNTAIIHDDDSGKTGRVRLDSVATLGDFQAGIGVRTDNAAAASPTFGPGMYYAGYKFFDGKFIVNAGNTDNSLTGTVNKGWGDGINTCGGIQAYVVPIDGLQVGAAVGGLTDTAAKMDRTIFKPSAGLAYAMPNFGDIRLNYEGHSVELWSAGVNYTAMPGLKAQFEGYYMKGAKRIQAWLAPSATAAATFQAVGKNADYEWELFQDFAYTIDAFTPELVAYEGQLDNCDLAYKINPTVDYKATSVMNLGAGVTYLSNKHEAILSDIGQVKPKDDGTKADGSAFSVSPYVQFNFNKLASCLKIWYETGDLMHADDHNYYPPKFEINFRSFF